MSFENIVGQKRQIRIIKKALENDRVPHAYLFLGERGIGKRLTAFNLAKALNCSNATDDSCDECGPCRRIAQGNHPDVGVVEPDGSFIKIDRIRELQRSLQYRSYEGKTKVRIIPDAEKMNPPAANALLKTLEEPPSDTILILTTASPDLLLPTIRSRCQRLKFQPLSNDLIVKVMKERLGKDHETALRIASLAKGSLGRAYELAETNLLEQKREYINRINTLSANDMNNTFKLAEEMSKDKGELLSALDILETWFRDLLVCKEGCPWDRLINIDLMEEIQMVSQKFTAMDLVERLRTINDAQSALARNSNTRLTMEVTLTRLSKESIGKFEEISSEHYNSNF